MRFPPFIKHIYTTLNTIEISQKALIHNYQYLSRVTSLTVAPVLKSNAYGHGLVLVAKVLNELEPPFFCIDSLYEAYELLKAGIKTPLLIMGYTKPENLKIKKLPFSFTVYDKETATVLNKYQKNVGIHIFVDTGMNREGIKLSELSEFLKYIKTLENIRIEGLMSHFAASEDYANLFTKEQVRNFTIAQEIFQKANITPKWVHMGNSAASLLSKYYKGKIGNMIRPGMAIYGLGGEVDDENLKAVAKVTTTLSQIKEVKKGEKIGYDFTYIAKKDMTIGILPYGYYDGVDRRLSNKGIVLINGIVCPIVGRVSMNITTIDISNVTNPRVGQNVIVYSNNPTDKNSFQNTALLIDKLQRDLFVHLASSTKRIVVK